ncbi:MAG: hypothetical protein QMD71_01325 [bacterium]|nr:hypothetical protein [bacterium]
MCRIVKLYKDPDIKKILELLKGDSGRYIGKGKFLYRYPVFSQTPQLLYSFITFITDSIPTVSEIQQIIEVKVIPAIDYILARFSIIENNPSFIFYLTPGMGHGVDAEMPDTIEIDVGDVYIGDAALRTVESPLRVLTAYYFDVVYDSLNDSLYIRKLIDTPNPFATLKPDGSTKMSTARYDLLNGVIKAKRGITSIFNETDDQSDDLLPNTDMTQADVDSAMATLDNITNALNNPIQIQVEDTSGMIVEITLDAKQFFINPIQDWKQKLPEHHWEGTDFIPDFPITFPDPTFNNIFPGMTNEDWRRIIGP